MKIAICLSGQVRTGVDSAPSLIKYIGDLWPNCDFFIHTWDTESYSSPGFSCDRYDRNNVQPGQLIETDPLIIEEYINIYKPKLSICEKYSEWESTPNRVSFDPHLYSVRKANLLKSKFEEDNNFKYDVVVRTRADLIYDPVKSLSEDIVELNGEPRKFCFAQGFDAPVIGNKIDNAFWLGSSYVIDQASNFEIIRGNAHPNFYIDGFVQFGFLVTMGLGFNVQKLKNSRIAAYREFHKDWGLDPIKDFLYIFENISRFDPKP